MAVLMFGAALPDLDWLLLRARQWSRTQTGQRVVIVDGVRMR